MHSIAKNLKQIRQQRGWTQQQMADVLYVTRQTISNWENGKSMPDIDMLANIAEKLGVDVNVLLYGLPVDNIKHQKHILINIVIFLCELALFVISSQLNGIVWTVINLFLSVTAMCFTAGALICRIMKNTGRIKNLPVIKHYKAIRTVIVFFMASQFLFFIPYMVTSEITRIYHSNYIVHQFTMVDFYNRSNRLYNKLNSLPVYQFFMNLWIDNFLRLDKPFLIQYIPYIMAGFVYEFVRPITKTGKEKLCTVYPKI